MHSFMITHLPVPENPEEAWDWINALDDEESESVDEISHPKFLALIEVLLARYPEDYPEDEAETCVWAEGPLRRSGSNDVLWVSVSGRQEGDDVQKFLIESACALGLTIFDTDSGDIYVDHGLR